MPETQWLCQRSNPSVGGRRSGPEASAWEAVVLAAWEQPTPGKQEGRDFRVTTQSLASCVTFTRLSPNLSHL